MKRAEIEAIVTAIFQEESNDPSREVDLGQKFAALSKLKQSKIIVLLEKRFDVRFDGDQEERIYEGNIRTIITVLGEALNIKFLRNPDLQLQAEVPERGQIQGQRTSSQPVFK